MPRDPKRDWEHPIDGSLHYLDCESLNIIHDGPEADCSWEPCDCDERFKEPCDCNNEEGY